MVSYKITVTANGKEYVFHENWNTESIADKALDEWESAYDHLVHNGIIKDYFIEEVDNSDWVNDFYGATNEGEIQELSWKLRKRIEGD